MSGIRWTGRDKADLALLADYIKGRTGAHRAPSMARVIRWALRRTVKATAQKRKDGR